MIEGEKGPHMRAERRRTYRADDLTKVAEKLDALPDADTQRGLSLASAVKFLAPQIEALRKKKYSMQEICEALKEAGVEITPKHLGRLMPGKSATGGVRGAGKSVSHGRKAGASRVAGEGNKEKSSGTKRG